MSIILYIGSSSDDTAERRRIKALSTRHNVFSWFLRGSTLAPASEDIIFADDYSFGFINRFKALCKLAKSLIFDVSRTRMVPDIIIAKNFDNLIVVVFCLFLRRELYTKSKLVYEICDIHKSFFSRYTSMLFLMLQRWLVRLRVQAVMVTSERFLDVLNLRHSGISIILWENFYTGFMSDEDVLSCSEFFCTRNRRIVYHGRIRCKRSVDILNNVPGFAVDMYGSYDVEVPVPPQIAKYSYPNDIPEILKDALFVWCVSGDDLNEISLLSNRLYDSLAFGCIPIVLSGSFQEEFLVRKSIKHVSFSFDMTPVDLAYKLELFIKDEGLVGLSPPFWSVRKFNWIPQWFH